MVQNPQQDFRPQPKEEAPPQEWDNRRGPRTLTPFQTMADFSAQGGLKDFRPNVVDSDTPEPPAEIRREIEEDFPSAPTGTNPVPTEPTLPEGLEELPPTTPSDLSSTSSDAPNPGKSVPPVEAPAPVMPVTPTPSSPAKVSPSSSDAPSAESAP